MSLGSASPCNSDGPLSSDDSYLGEFSAERQNEQPVCSAYSLPPPEKVKIDFMPPVDVGTHVRSSVCDMLEAVGNLSAQ